MKIPVFIREKYVENNQLIDYSIFKPLIPYITVLDSTGYIEINVPSNLIIDRDKIISYIPDATIRLSSTGKSTIDGHMDINLINILNQMYINARS